MRLSAALIVRDEAATIRRCLAPLRDLVDEIVVHDTGSSDDTAHLAASLGARVIQGTWHDDFARARNVALEACSGDWVISVDADELAAGDREMLLGQLALADAAGIDVFAVATVVHAAAELGGTFRNWQPRLFRRAATRWAGRVHERPVFADGIERTPHSLNAAALNLRHDGYADAAVARVKAERNLHLGIVEVQELAQGDDAPALAAALFDLGRSLVGVGRVEESLDPFRDVRNLMPSGSPLWCEATDFLARQQLVLQDGRGACESVQELYAAAPQHEQYCRWLLAHALLITGDFRQAIELMRGVDRLVDTRGHDISDGMLQEFRGLLSELTAVLA